MECRFQKGNIESALMTTTTFARMCGRHSAPGCHGAACGAILHIKDGKFVDIEGDESNPITQGRLCIKCLNMTEFEYHPERIIYPMKRDPKDRGKNAWERITWDEAYDLIEENYNKVVEKTGTPNAS